MLLQHDFPGVDHEGRQTCQLWFPWSHKGNPCIRAILTARVQRFFHLFILSTTSEKLFIPYKPSAAVQAL